jgi:RimJ/RimL family protein N-acetyltransferase
VLADDELRLTQRDSDLRKWQMLVRGEPAACGIEAGIVVPNARRARVTVTGWSSRLDECAERMLRLLLGHLFSRDAARQIEFGAVDVEQGLLDAALRCGFVEEGRRRHAAIVNGYWRDHVCMTLFSAQWGRTSEASPASFRAREPEPVSANMPPIPSVEPKDFANLEGDRVRLRRKRDSDRDLFYGWVCRDEWWKGWMPQDPDGFSAPKREEFEAEWNSNASSNAWVVEMKSSKPVGVCFYSSLDRKNRSAEADILLYDSSAWGQGLGTDAYRVLLRHLFEDLHLHRVRSGTWNGNVASLKMQLKCGLKVEAESSDSYFVDGKWYGGVGTGMLESEWRAGQRPSVKTLMPAPG